MLFFLISFHLFLTNRLGRLIGIRQSKKSFIGPFYLLGLGLFGARFFSSNSLSLYFESNKNSIRRAITFRVTDIQVSDYNVRF